MCTQITSYYYIYTISHNEPFVKGKDKNFSAKKMIALIDAQLTVFSLNTLSEQKTETQIIDLNQKTEQYGLTLTPQDAKALIRTRSEELSANGRVEVGSETITKIIEAFCDSAFIDRSNYAETMQELLRIFYYAKNDTLERISDDELIAYMKDSFENRCMGSLELLKGRELEKLAEQLDCRGENNCSSREYQNRYDGDYEDEESEGETWYTYERDDWYDQ